ncbi:oxidoreductase [Acidisoma silvae]|uniref:SDR family NAD(P)-dependent oxidoreductase n=1 Tax=Acidisoma silvae TaxID=2802396 RepID=A0A964E130_9PROT|nr:oxidoreductase [Acidisoma silvae]MCB8878145.1 SDR family NAD(P)-dependent oxidoreductase [Acidisoma silvae]
MAEAQSPVWLITGCSTGFGRELALRVIKKGWRVIVTARNTDQIADLISAGYDKSFVLALALDITKAADIDTVISRAKSQFGRIDVLVNNAGYGYQSSVEEGDDAEIRAQFDTNVFGLFALTRAVLPMMRAQHSGHIINVTSVAGLMGFPGSGYYAASKHAIEGWSDSLLAEVKPLGIHVTCVEPGPFRTDWAGRSLRQTITKITDYAKTAGERMSGIKDISGTQAGDPGRASDIMIRLTQQANPPRHLVLGAIGFENVTKQLKARLDEIQGEKDTALAADFPKA